MKKASFRPFLPLLTSIFSEGHAAAILWKHVLRSWDLYGTNPRAFLGVTSHRGKTPNLISVTSNYSIFLVRNKVTKHPSETGSPSACIESIRMTILRYVYLRSKM